MAYTYKDFEDEARKTGLLGQFSGADLALARADPDAGMSLLSYKKDYAGATTDAQRALPTPARRASATSTAGTPAAWTGVSITRRPPPAPVPG